MPEPETTVEEVVKKPKRKYIQTLRAEKSKSEISIRVDQYANLRVLGFKPIEAVEAMDAEEGRIRSKASRYAEASLLERTTTELRADLTLPGDMNDSQFSTWKSGMYKRMAYHPKEFNTVAMAAVEALEKEREKKQYSTTEATLKTLDASFDELLRLADPALWTHPKKGSLVHREAEPTGDEAPPVLDGDGGGNAPAAILGVLRGFVDEQKDVVVRFEALLGKLSETGSAAKVCS